MNYLANIISKDKGDYGPLYNSVTNIGDCVVGLPTLIVGWDLANKLYPSEIDVLNRKISRDISWTYSKYERREENEKDCREFFHEVLDRFANNVKYVYFDVILESDENKKKFIGEYKNSVFYENKSMIYMYIHTKNMVLGVSKVELDYFGYKPEVFVKSMEAGGAKNITSQYSRIPKDVWEAYKWRRYMIPAILNIF